MHGRVTRFHATSHAAAGRLSTSKSKVRARLDRDVLCG